MSGEWLGQVFHDDGNGDINVSNIGIQSFIE
jgi:hypothetical protein